MVVVNQESKLGQRLFIFRGTTCKLSTYLNSEQSVEIDDGYARSDLSANACHFAARTNAILGWITDQDPLVQKWNWDNG